MDIVLSRSASFVRRCGRVLTAKQYMEKVASVIAAWFTCAMIGGELLEEAASSLRVGSSAKPATSRQMSHGCERWQMC